MQDISSLSQLRQQDRNSHRNYPIQPFPLASTHLPPRHPLLTPSVSPSSIKPNTTI
jgi:hypothetical protein